MPRTSIMTTLDIRSMKMTVILPFSNEMQKPSLVSFGDRTKVYHEGSFFRHKTEDLRVHPRPVRRVRKLPVESVRPSQYIYQRPPICSDWLGADIQYTYPRIIEARMSLSSALAKLQSTAISLIGKTRRCQRTAATHTCPTQFLGPILYGFITPRSSLTYAGSSPSQRSGTNSVGFAHAPE